MPKRKVADVVIEVLQEAGALRCYGIVGDTLNHVTDAIRRSSIEWVHVRHEEAGALAAGAEASLTGRLTVCAGSCGPGSLHFINGMFEANRNRAPVVLIASQVNSDELGMEFPQEVDFKPLYKECSVFCEAVINPAAARRLAVQAVQAALTRQGVAVLILSGDISAMEAEEGPRYRTHAPRPVLLPASSELDDIARMLRDGGKIAVYAGAGCADARDQVIEFCRMLKAPMAHTSRAKDFLEWDNPFNVGMTGVFGSPAGYKAVAECDTLVMLGCDFAWRQFYPDHARLIQIDRDPTHIGRRHPVDIGVVGDIAPTLRALLPLMSEQSDETFLNARLHDAAAARSAYERQEQPGKNGIIHPQHVARMLDLHADEDAIFSADNGSPMVWLLRHVRATRHRRTMVSLLHGTMANAMPQALGIKKAMPSRQVICMSGDGGLAMLLGDLLTAIQEDLAIKVVVFNNSSLGFVDMEMKTEGFIDVFTELKNPDFAKLAQVVGFAGWRIENNAELERSVQAFLAHPGPALMDVVVNRDELIMPPSVEPGKVLGMAVYTTKAILAGRGSDVVDMISSNFVRR